MFSHDDNEPVTMLDYLPAPPPMTLGDWIRSIGLYLLDCLKWLLLALAFGTVVTYGVWWHTYPQRFGREPTLAEFVQGVRDTADQNADEWLQGVQSEYRLHRQRRQEQP